MKSKLNLLHILKFLHIFKQNVLVISIIDDIVTHQYKEEENGCKKVFNKKEWSFKES